MYFPSAYNHFVRIDNVNGCQKYVVSNLFFGAADIVSAPVFAVLERAEKAGHISEHDLPADVLEHFRKKGYLWSAKTDEADVVERVSYTYGNRTEIAAGLGGGQYGFITSLHCNLDCPYCFQKLQAHSTGFLTKEQVDLGLRAIAACEEDVSESIARRSLPKISITGGEPLLQNAKNVETVDYLLGRLEALSWPYNITTNGTELQAFISNHKYSPRCRNIQVTLDGPREIHDSRRFYKNRRPSFQKIVSGIDAAIAEGWKLTLRVNLDLSNVNKLPELAEFVLDKNWTRNGKFSAYVSPVTDHGSIPSHTVPSDEADLLDALLSVIIEAPQVKEIFDIKHFRGFNYVERILVEKKPRFPVLYRCEAVTGMYIFDPLGDVHVCLETVGDRKQRVGQYSPRWTLDAHKHARWTSRNVLTLPGCDKCKIRFLCAGGCTLESFNKGDGNTCMPFLREMDIAWAFFGRTMPEIFP